MADKIRYFNVPYSTGVELKTKLDNNTAWATEDGSLYVRGADKIQILIVSLDGYTDEEKAMADQNPVFNSKVLLWDYMYNAWRDDTETSQFLVKNVRAWQMLVAWIG